MRTNKTIAKQFGSESDLVFAKAYRQSNDTIP